MKNLLLLCFLMVGSSFAEVCLEGRSTTEDLMGNIVNKEVCYINVKNTLGSVLAKGNAVVLNVAEADGFSVTTSATAGQVPHCILAQACNDDQVCKCQTYGYADFVSFDSTNGTATAGSLAFISESTAAYVQSEANGSIATSDAPIGVFVNSVAASGSAKVFLKLR